MRLPRSAIAAVVALSILAAPVRAHPLHTTYTELSIYHSGSSVRALIRVFADDFSATVIRNYPVARRSDRDFQRAAYTYVAHRFRIIDERGVTYALGWCGLRRQANFIWLCLGSDTLSNGVKGKLVNQLLNEVFTDQINIVRVSAEGRTMHILFAQGDSAKPLR